MDFIQFEEKKIQSGSRLRFDPTFFDTHFFMFRELGSEGEGMADHSSNNTPEIGRNPSEVNVYKKNPNSLNLKNNQSAGPLYKLVNRIKSLLVGSGASLWACSPIMHGGSTEPSTAQHRDTVYFKRFSFFRSL